MHHTPLHDREHKNPLLPNLGLSSIPHSQSSVYTPSIPNPPALQVLSHSVSISPSPLTKSPGGFPTHRVRTDCQKHDDREPQSRTQRTGRARKRNKYRDGFEWAERRSWERRSRAQTRGEDGINGTQRWCEREFRVAALGDGNEELGGGWNVATQRFDLVASRPKIVAEADWGYGRDDDGFHCLICGLE